MQCRSLTLCIRPDSELTKVLDHPKRNPDRGEGLRQINTCRKVPLQENFLDDDILNLLSIRLIFQSTQFIINIAERRRKL